MGKGNIIKTFTSHGVILTLWDNPVTKDGIEVMMSNITIKKMHKKNEASEWKYFDNFRPSEIPNIIEAIELYLQYKESNE